jgi:hypothetical protein
MIAALRLQLSLKPAAIAGPWEVGKWIGSISSKESGGSWTGEHAAVFYDDEHGGGMVCSTGLAASDKCAEPTAHLISAAPDMLLILKKIEEELLAIKDQAEVDHNHTSGDCWCDDYFRRLGEIQAAITKAEGCNMTRLEQVIIKGLYSAA